MSGFSSGVILDLESFDRGDLNQDRLNASVSSWQSHPYTQADQTAERIRNAEVVITNKVFLGETELAAAEQIKLICVAATGTNNIDLECARRRGVPVCNVRGYATPSVVEQLFAGLLTLIRQLDAYRAACSSGAWSRSRQFCLLDYSMGELAGKRLGIIGFGELGRGVARVAEAFGMEVVVALRPGSAPQPGRIAIPELLPQIDVLTIHTPLTPQTQQLIGSRELALLPSHAIVINTARGGIVDEPALVAALRCGTIGGAVVDVLTQEPPPTNHPLIAAAELPNLILTPHIAWASVAARQRLIDQLAENIFAFAGGNPLNVVA